MFDIQNVLPSPQADVSSFFYKSKLNVYNLTAHFSRTKNNYGCLWSEVLSGRSGNNLASALQKILKALYENHPDIKKKTWTFQTNITLSLLYTVLDSDRDFVRVEVT